MVRRPQCQQFDRPGSIAVEVAVLLPLIVFVCVIGVDFARVFVRTIILETASRNAAYFAAQDPIKANDDDKIRAIALNDLDDLAENSTVTIERYTGVDGYPRIRVSIQHDFITITSFPGVPQRSQLNRSTEMRICPTLPKPGTY